MKKQLGGGRGRPFLVIIALAAATRLLGAEDFNADFVAAHKDATVDQVVYQGNTRTQNSALEILTGLEPGQKLGGIDPEYVRQKLLKSGIFSEVKLSADMKDQDKVQLTVAVKDKWTLLPIPSGSYGSGGWSAGLDVVEYNFLGLDKTLVLGGSASNLGPSLMLAYVDPIFLRNQSTLQAFVSYANLEHIAANPDGSAFSDYTCAKARAGLSISAPITKQLKLAPEVIVRYLNLPQAQSTLLAMGTDSFYVVPGCDLDYDGQTVTGYHKSGTYATLTYNHGIAVSGQQSYDEADCSLDQKVGTFLDGVADFGLVGYLSDQAFPIQPSLSGSGFRTVPQDETFSGRYAGGYACLDLPFLNASWAVMTLGAFYEGGLYTTGLDSSELCFFHGPGLSYRLYLHDIALPAAGIDAAYNVVSSQFAFSVNVGVSL